MDTVTVKVIRRARRDDVIRLYRAAGWWKPCYSGSTAAVNALVKGSLCFVGAFHGRRLIGMGRSISDGVSDAYIQDVTVLPEFRGKGIGRRIILYILDCLRERRIEWIGLIAEPGHGQFYRELGFTALEGFTPMIWSRHE